MHIDIEVEIGMELKVGIEIGVEVDLIRYRGKTGSPANTTAATAKFFFCGTRPSSVAPRAPCRARRQTQRTM